jgi:hypothetical protein
MNTTGAGRVSPPFGRGNQYAQSMNLDRTQPIYVHKTYWPASVLLPNKTVWHRCRVFVTSQGLAIFERRADEPHFLSPMDWAATPEPRKPPMHVGIDLHTEAGLVVVTRTGGCACGSSLKSWLPDWAGNVQVWPQPVQAS